jgi:uncharacterized protein YgfB (UPF0149 family)
MLMTAPVLPDFDHTVHLGQGNLDTAGLAECHGVLCGLVCRSPGDATGDFLHHLAELQLLVNPDVALRAALMEAFECTAQQLEDEDMGFELWLPDDDEQLEDRTIALAHWCNGFLAGLASGGPFDILSEEAGEAVDDLQQIARAELVVPEAGDQDSEEDEVAYTEIVEYVRVVTLMMHEDFRGPGAHDPIH